MSETGTAPETVLGDQRGSTGTRTDKECGQCTRGGPKNVIEIFRGQHWQSFMHWQKRELSGHQSATVGVVLRGMIETASQPPTRILCGELEWTVVLLDSLPPTANGLRRW